MVAFSRPLRSLASPAVAPLLARSASSSPAAAHLLGTAAGASSPSAAGLLATAPPPSPYVAVRFLPAASPSPPSALVFDDTGSSPPPAAAASSPSAAPRLLATAAASPFAARFLPAASSSPSPALLFNARGSSLAPAPAASSPSAARLLVTAAASPCAAREIEALLPVAVRGMLRSADAKEAVLFADNSALPMNSFAEKEIQQQIRCSVMKDLQTPQLFGNLTSAPVSRFLENVLWQDEVLGTNLRKFYVSGGIPPQEDTDKIEDMTNDDEEEKQSDDDNQSAYEGKGVHENTPPPPVDGDKAAAGNGGDSGNGRRCSENYILYELSELRKEMRALHWRSYKQTSKVHAEVGGLKKDVDDRFAKVRAIMINGALKFLVSIIVLLLTLGTAIAQFAAPPFLEKLLEEKVKELKALLRNSVN